jgi:L-seryl-tRNA(Ser) seleniumtransferase
VSDFAQRPPSVDTLARRLANSHNLPHAILVDCARRAIQTNPQLSEELALRFAEDFAAVLTQDVINATGVLLHTNLGRSPLVIESSGRPLNIEFDLRTGERGSRQSAISHLIGLITGAESAIVVNNNAAAVMLVAAALATGRDIAVSRGESVEIGGGFRVPEVLEQSGARLVDVGTTNKTRLADYSRAVESRRNDIAFVMKIHPSNFSMQGFTSQTTVKELSSLEVPVVADIGSGLVDNTCPWLAGQTDRIPSWIRDEPAARQALDDGASLVTFSGDKLLGGPQCGIIAGKKELVDICVQHPLMRALRVGAHTLVPLQKVLLSYLNRSVCDEIPFWSMATTPLHHLKQRAINVVSQCGIGTVVEIDSLIGAGSAPGTTIESFGIKVDGDHRESLRRQKLPIISRTFNGQTFLDLRTVSESDDVHIADALRALR